MSISAEYTKFIPLDNMVKLNYRKGCMIMTFINTAYALALQRSGFQSFSDLNFSGFHFTTA